LLDIVSNAVLQEVILMGCSEAVCCGYRKISLWWGCAINAKMLWFLLIKVGQSAYLFGPLLKGAGNLFHKVWEQLLVFVTWEMWQVIMLCVLLCLSTVEVP